MYKTFFLLFLGVASVVSGQTRIGKIEGAEIILEGDVYEVLFQTPDKNLTSFNIQKGVDGEDGFSALKKHIWLLFDNEREEEFLLQFLHDSVLLVYKNQKVQMIRWVEHDGDQREYSKEYTFAEYFDLFGLGQERKRF